MHSYICHLHHHYHTTPTNIQYTYVRTKTHTEDTIRGKATDIKVIVCLYLCIHEKKIIIVFLSAFRYYNHYFFLCLFCFYL